MAEICTSPYPIKKVRDFPYPYPVNAGILHQNEDGFEQYPQEQIYLLSLLVILLLVNYGPRFWALTKFNYPLPNFIGLDHTQLGLCCKSSSLWTHFTMSYPILFKLKEVRHHTTYRIFLFVYLSSTNVFGQLYPLTDN